MRHFLLAQFGRRPLAFNWFCCFDLLVYSLFLGLVHVLVCMDVSIYVRVFVFLAIFVVDISPSAERPVGIFSLIPLL